MLSKVICVHYISNMSLHMGPVYSGTQSHSFLRVCMFNLNLCVCVCVCVCVKDKVSAVKTESPAPSKKVENLQGCDLLQEVSVTIRRFKKTSIPKERSDQY